MNGIPTGPNLLLTLLLVGAVVLRFLLRELRVRKIPLNRLFVLPLIFGLLVVLLVYATLSQSPDQLVPLLVGSLAALLAGTVIGLAVAHFTSVAAGPVPGVVLVRGSATTVAIWIAALLLRLIPRLILGATTHVAGTTLMLNAVLLVMLAVAIFVVRLQISRRATSLEAVGQSR